MKKGTIFIAALAMLLPGMARADWFKVTSPHFTVYAEGKPDELKTYIAKLERYDGAMRILYGVPDTAVGSSSRVTIFVVRDAAKAVGMDNILGVYMPRPGGPVAFASKDDEEDVRGISRMGIETSAPLTAQAVLFHEYAHHFMFTAWPDVPFPAWLAEGFAEYNGPSIIGKDGSVSIGAPPNYRAGGARSDEMSAADLLRSDTAKLDFDEVQALYGRGWLLVHYLMADPDRQKELNVFLKALTAGTDPVKAGTAAFGDLHALDRKLNEHANARIMGKTIRGSAIKVGKIDIRPLTEAEDAVMPALLRSKAGVSDKTAPDVAKLAERLAKPFPTDPAAQNELAEAEFDAKNYEAADAAAARALSADPKSLHATIYRGKAEMEIAKRDKVTDPGRWKAIRAWFGAANRLDTENAEPLDLFYQSYVAAGEAPTKNAEDGLLYAEVLAPFDSGLRLEAATVLLNRKQVPAARTVLQSLAANPHAGDEAKFATKIVADIDAGDIKKAQADLAAGPSKKDEDKK